MRTELPIGTAASLQPTVLANGGLTGHCVRVSGLDDGATDGGSTVHVPRTYREWWKAWKPLTRAERATVGQAAMGRVEGITVEQAAIAIAFGRYYRRGFYLAPVVTPVLSFIVGTVAGLDRLANPYTLLAEVIGISVVAVFYISGSYAADSANKAVVASGTSA